MLIQFSFGNYRSFRDTETLSLVAAPLSSPNPELDENNTIRVGEKLCLLKSAAVYGANASGKSNLWKAIAFMRNFVLALPGVMPGPKIDVEPFRLSTETSGKPSTFEVVFLAGGRRYRYGFEVSTDRVLSEWLHDLSGRKEARLFERKNDDFDLSRSFKEGKGLTDKTRPEALFLTVVAQFNGPTAIRVTRWFANLNSIESVTGGPLRQVTLNFWTNPKRREAILRFVQGLDLWISNIQIEKQKFDRESLPLDMPEALRNIILSMPDLEQVRVHTFHQKYNSQGEEVGIEGFELDRHESGGTQTLFSFAGAILDTLENGRILVIDELDARLHPLITRAIVEMFNSNVTNPRNAQLIFTTHDTNLLSSKILRRDQIWFVDKDRTAASHLISLAEYGVRNTASFEQDYIHGKFGAVPYIGDLSWTDSIGELNSAESVNVPN